MPGALAVPTPPNTLRLPRQALSRGEELCTPHLVLPASTASGPQTGFRSLQNEYQFAGLGVGSLTFHWMQGPPALGPVGGV